MPLEIQLIPDRMFPEASLPKCVFAIEIAFDSYTRGNEPVRKVRFDSPPAAGKVTIVRWQRQDRMQMVGQNHDDRSISKVRSNRAIRNAMRIAFT